MKTPGFYLLFQSVVGFGDAFTGALLIFSPRFTLRAMGVDTIPGPLTFVSFIGAFVFSVGLSYLLFLRFPRTPEAVAAVRTLWLLTGLQRLCVAVFVLVAFLAKELDSGWLLVSAFDFTFAAIQLGPLRSMFAASK